MALRLEKMRLFGNFLKKSARLTGRSPVAASPAAAPRPTQATGRAEAACGRKIG
jgi:hypothetical protein